MTKPTLRDRILFALEPATEALKATAVAIFATTVIYSLGSVGADSIGSFGSDMTQRIMTWVSPGSALKARPDKRPGGATAPTKYVFMDIGWRFCEGRKDGRPTCPPDAPVTDRKGLAELVGWVDKAGPRVIVVDVALPPVAPGGQPAASAAKAGADPALDVLKTTRSPVLLAWSPPRERLEPRNPKDGESAKARHPGWRANMVQTTDPRLNAGLPLVRELPAMVSSAGPVSRQLMPDLEIVWSTGAEVQPSLAYGAALVALAPADKPFQHLSGLDQKHASSGKAQIACLPDLAAACIKGYFKTERVFSFRTGEPNKTTSPGKDLGYWHMKAPAIGDLPEEPSYELDDAVVVIGDGRLSSGDQHWTAMGEVSGAEVLINDIRQFAVTAPVAKPAVHEKVWNKAPLFILGGLAALFVYLVEAARFPPKPAANSLGGWGRRVGRSSLRLLATTVLTASVFIAYFWLRPPTSGGAPDLLTPFFALALEGAFEVLHGVTHGLELLRRAAAKYLRKRWNMPEDPNAEGGH